MKSCVQAFGVYCICMLCFAGVGTRNYYRKMGYELQGPYMVKELYEVK